MLLEAFRDDEIGCVYFGLLKSDGYPDPSAQVFASYISYAFRAFYLTMQDIDHLEP
jgi:hypothetical protein